jgi:hypothetical protein
MPYNGSGTFTLPAGNPVVTGTTISSTVNNNTNSDLANGLSNAVTRNGQSPPTANLPMGNFKLTGLAAGTQAGDSARYDELILKANLISPVLVTPNLGTPSAGVLTNCTGTAAGLSIGGNAATATTVTTNANLTGAVTSVGNAASLGSFTSAQLATALTDETGSGSSVFAVGPALTGTPTAPTAAAGTNTTQLATTANVYASSLGWGQTWTGYSSGSRPSGTTFTNSTGKPIFLTCTVGQAGSVSYLTISGVTAGSTQPSNAGGMAAVIPSGATYSVNYSVFYTWAELR